MKEVIQLLRPHQYIKNLFVFAPLIFSFHFVYSEVFETIVAFMLSWFFKGMSKDDFLKVANEYSLVHIDKILRPKAIEKINWHKNQGHKVVVVSASIECWLRPWCEKNVLELIATKLEIKDDIVTGKLLSKNCYGVEKVNRIKELYNIEKYDYIYAYGDSSGDKQMLELAHEKFYKPFRD